MADLHRILTPLSLERYSSWPEVIDPYTYEFVGPGESDYEIIIKTMKEDGTVTDSIRLNTTVHADDWLNKVVAQLNSEDASNDGSATWELSNVEAVGTSTTSTDNDNNFPKIALSSCSQFCNYYFHCRYDCTKCKSYYGSLAGHTHRKRFVR